MSFKPLYVLILAAFGLCLAPLSAQAAASSCSVFAVIKGYDAAAPAVALQYTKASEAKFFPLPEGSQRGNSKFPKKCRGKVTRQKDMNVKLTGGRLSITQVRGNWFGKMLNDPDDEAWLPAKLSELIEAKTEVMLVIRPGLQKGSALSITTIYLPITQEELDDIARLERQIEDVE